MAGASVSTLASQLFSLCLGLDTSKADKAQEAFKCAQQSQEQKLEEELDSEFEEVLDCHKEDQYNTSDLKDLEKFRKKKARKARNLATKQDWSSAPIPAAKRKAKAKAKTKAKAKMSFGEKLRHMASLSALANEKQQDEVVPVAPETVAVADPEDASTEPASALPRVGHRGPGIEQTPEALQWPPPPGCSVGYSKVGDTTAWQAKLPAKTKFKVPYGRVSEQNTLYVQFDSATFGQELSKEVVDDLNRLHLDDILYFRKMVSAGTKKSLSSAEARCMCCRWLQSWYDSVEH